MILNLYMVHPPDSGAKVIIRNRIVELSRHFDVTFCCLAERADDVEAAGALREYAEVVVARPADPGAGLLTRWRDRAIAPSAELFREALRAWLRSPDTRELLRRRRFDLVELHSACWYRPELDALPAPLVLVALNDEREYWTGRARAVARTGRMVAAAGAVLDALQVARQERRTLRQADAIVALSPLDCERLSRRMPGRPALTNRGGVDCDHYADVAQASPRPVDPVAPVLTLVAALFVDPAADAARRFADRVLPAVRQRYPHARFILVGDHREHPEILRLRDRPGVEIRGRVDDVRPHLREADVVVVPIVYGSGVRTKIMEACAAGKPIVSTRKGAEGLDLDHGRELMLADTVEEMVQPVLQLLGDDALRARLGREALAVARQRFDRRVEHDRLADWYRDLLRGSAGGAPGGRG